jgi:TetR/AcrR family transcriptional repressor of nem operon
MRVRRFFEATTDNYQDQGYLGCMLGGLGQELSGVNDKFRTKIESCFTFIGSRIEATLADAKKRGELAKDADPKRMAMLIVNCWEGAALRSRLQQCADPLGQMLDFILPSPAPKKPATEKPAGARKRKSSARA